MYIAGNVSLIGLKKTTMLWEGDVTKKYLVEEMLVMAMHRPHKYTVKKRKGIISAIRANNSVDEHSLCAC